MEEVEFLVVGCGPAGGIAAREAARSGVETLVLERDPVVGERRVCAAGLRPGFCANFDLPRSLVHFDVEHLSLFDIEGRRYDFPYGPAHTTTREELDGTIGRLAQSAGATIRTSSLFRSLKRDGEHSVVEYADLAGGTRKAIRARRVFMAQGSSARFEAPSRLSYDRWSEGLITCYQYRVYPQTQALPEAYSALELHYYVSELSGRVIVAWSFPKRGHLSIGLGIGNRIPGGELRAELDHFLDSCAKRLFPGIEYRIKEEGNLLYGGLPRPRIADGNVLLGGTAAGLVDATTGEGIHEAATSGRYAAEAVFRAKRGSSLSAAQVYERLTKSAFYGRLRRHHTLMNYLERRPARYGVLFGQMLRTPRFFDLLQRDRCDYGWRDWLYLYAQVARFGLRALRS
jgi:digeranylgeranylglycerophospholipid reductase